MKIPKEIDVNEVMEYLLNCSSETKVYIGCDSEKYRLDGEWVVDYTTAVVIHRDGKHGCKVFGALQREKDYDRKKDRPSYRLMNEVYKAADIYLKLAGLLDNEIAIHLDLNPSHNFASSHVVNQAIGYIRGVCGIEPEVKPEAWAASYAADRLKEIFRPNYRVEKISI